MLTRLIALAALLVALAAGPVVAAQPNFIIFIADDVSVDDIGCYGHPHIRTPNIDAMAAGGLRFDKAFLTISSCSPSRCSILTGRYPHATGAGELHQPLPADQTVFPELLQEAGYYTASAGKWHLGPHPRSAFDRIEGGGPSGCEKWEAVVRERPRDKPFFFWFAAIDAHRGWSKHAVDPPHTREDVIVPPFLPDEPAVRDDLALYYDEISRLDSYVGKVIAALKEQEALDNTLLLFMADNGRPFPRCKTTVYDSGIQTPFVLHWPAGVNAKQTTPSLVSSVDIAPTFLELAGAKRPASLQGKSFAKILQDPQATTREFVFAEHNWHDYQAHKRAVRSGRCLYIRNAFPKLTGSPPADAVRSPTYAVMQEREASGKLPKPLRDPFVTPRPAEEFYDCEADPHQLKNLAGDPKYADEQQRLEEALEAWIERTADRVPENPTPDKFDRRTGLRLKP